MTTNSAITIYHKDNTNQSYARTFCPKAWVHEKEAISYERGGVEEDGVTAIRIPLPTGFLRGIGTKSNASGATECSAKGGEIAAILAVTLGDYVYLGSSESAGPPKDLCKKVVAVHGNFSGTQPHIKLMVR